jgi:ATP synthase protein I
MSSSPDANTIKMIGQLSTIGLAFVFALVLGFGAGFWLDERLGTKPWLSLLGFAMGLAAGVLNVVRTMQTVGRASSPAGGPKEGGQA